MNQRKFFIILGTLFFITTGLFFGERVQIAVGRAGQEIGSVLASPLLIVTSISRSQSLRETADMLLLENEALKGEVAALQKTSLLAREPQIRETRVFSSYPFNHRNLLMIDHGVDEGFRPGWGVAAEKSLLLGKIIEVFSHTSRVQTIFDADMTLPVKIGAKEVDALLVGGRIPKLTLIEKDARIFPGDEVYSSGSDFPYGLRVGEVLELLPEPSSAFQEASLTIPYDAGSLDTVYVFIL